MDSLSKLEVNAQERAKGFQDEQGTHVPDQVYCFEKLQLAAKFFSDDHWKVKSLCEHRISACLHKRMLLKRSETTKPEPDPQSRAEW